MYFFFSSFIDTLFLYIGSCDRFYTYIVLIFLYMWMYVSSIPLYTCFLLIVCNLLFLFHTKMP